MCKTERGNALPRDMNLKMGETLRAGVFPLQFKDNHRKSMALKHSPLVICFLAPPCRT